MKVCSTRIIDFLSSNFILRYSNAPFTCYSCLSDSDTEKSQDILSSTYEEPKSKSINIGYEPYECKGWLILIIGLYFYIISYIKFSFDNNKIHEFNILTHVTHVFYILLQLT